MKYALFLGCTIPARARNYELSARKISDQLGIELIDVEDFICCGFPVKSGDQRSSLVLGAYNLALAESKGLNICTLCSSCTSMLAETAYHLSKNNEQREEVNKRLALAGLHYSRGVKVRHFARILYEEVGTKEIKRHVQKPLDDLSIAIHYGCHYLRPSEVYEGFDEPEDPKTLDALVALTEAKVTPYRDMKSCCGGPVLPVDEKTALSVAKQKLDHLVEAGVDALCLICPFCSVMYDSNQKSIEASFETTYRLPVLYLPQILGLAMGFDRKELGLDMNVVKTKELLAQYYQKD